MSDDQTQPVHDEEGFKRKQLYIAGFDAPRVIRMLPGELPETVSQCELAAQHDVFVRGTELVRIGNATELPHLEAEKRDPKQSIILAVSAEWLRLKLMARARFEKLTAKKEKVWVTVDCPPDISRTVLLKGDWPYFRPLRGIARAPFLRVDGSVNQNPWGHDLASHFFSDHGGMDFPLIPERPTREDAEQALRVLMQPFSEFPYSSPASRSAFLATILVEVVRPALDSAPMTFYTAPSAGSGKTLLAWIPSLIAHGVLPATQSWPTSEEELKKTIFASLRCGDRSVLFDNLQNGAKIRSNEMCAVLTSPEITQRILGVSENQTLPNKTVFVGTGNNLTPTGDIARRSIVVRLDANVSSEKLRERTFTIADLPKYVRENRPQLLAAALTIVRACLVAEFVGPVPLPSFERWSRFVRDPLVWLGMPDPVSTQLLETDDESTALGDAFAAIAESAVGKTPFTADGLAADLRFAIDERAELIGLSGCADATDAQKLGFWLRSNRDRTASGFKLRQLKRSHGMRKWRLVDQATYDLVGGIDE